MVDKFNFVRRSKRLRIAFTGAALLMFVLTPFYPRETFIGWIVFVLLSLIPLARLRCWNCGERLLKDGGSHIEYCRTGVVTWDMCRHKTCGAELH